MWMLLNPRVWIGLVFAAILTATHVSAYRAGEKSIRTAWDAAITAQALETLKVSEAYRARETGMQTKLKKAEADYATAKKLNADLAAGTADSLRDFEAANRSAAAADPGTRPGTAGPGGLEYELLGSCAKALVQLGQEADRLEAKVIGLQDYIKAVK